MSTVPVHLSPLPGFCVKSATLQPAVYSPRPSPPPPPPSPNSLEPSQHGPIPIPKGLKVFVNICWDKNVPPPPEGSEEAIQCAMNGQDEDDSNPDGWYVPVVVSDGRMDKDKAGKPSLVFDCVYNTTVKSRTLRDPQFKIFLVELALQRIEAQAHLLLSRQIGTPNITAKGKLDPRTVNIPTALLHPTAKQPQEKKKNPLIQEIDGTNAKKDQDGGLKLKGILKNKDTKGKLKESDTPPDVNAKPAWTWDKQPDARLRLTIHIPAITHDLIKDTALDLEPRRLTLSIPLRPTFTIDLNLSDAEIVSNAQHEPTKELQDVAKMEPNRTLLLKRQRDFDVDQAEAEWRVADNVLMLWC